MFEPLPASAAWRHLDSRAGFEVAFFAPGDRDGHRISGCTTAVEDSAAWSVRYDIDVDASWRTRRARIQSLTSAGRAWCVIEGDGEGQWRVNGSAALELGGCLDVDLESSAMTNTLPIHRLALPIAAAADAPAVYVRAGSLLVERLEQRYRHHSILEYDYAAPVFDFQCRIEYDPSGLVLDYPGIARRVH